jgi:FlaA1/EpsC-like NDP-sugar epimerase
MNNKFKNIIIFIGDILVFYIAFFSGLFLRNGFCLNNDVIARNLIPFSVLFIFWIIIFLIFHLYETSALKNDLKFYGLSIQALVICFLSSVILLYFFAPTFTPKRNLIFILGAFAILFLIYRSIINNYLKTQKRINLILIGTSKIEEQVKNYLNNNKQYNYLIKYHFAEVQENVQKIKKLILQEEIDLIVYTKDVKEINKIFFPFIDKKIESIDLASFYMEVFKKVPLEEIDEE